MIVNASDEVWAGPRGIERRNDGLIVETVPVVDATPIERAFGPKCETH